MRGAEVNISLAALGDKVDISLAAAAKRAVSLKACMDRACAPDRDREGVLAEAHRTGIAALFARKRAGSLSAEAYKAGVRTLAKRRASGQAASDYVSCALRRCDEAVRDLLLASSARTQDRLLWLRETGHEVFDASAMLKRTRALIRKRAYTKADLPQLYAALVLEPY